MTPLQLLLIEDDVLIAENLRLSLMDLGYEVITVCNSYSDAHTAIIESAYDFVIMDINLGDAEGRTGLDLARLLKRVRPVPFIFITAYSDMDTISSASQLQPSAYLVKPVNERTIFSTIQIAFQNYSSNQFSESPEEKNADTAYFFVKTGTRNYKVYWKEVYLVRAVKNYIEIRTAGSASVHLLRTSLTQCMDALLPAALRPFFIRINRSEAIHIRYVKAYSRQGVRTEWGDFEINQEAYALLEKNRVHINTL